MNKNIPDKKQNIHTNLAKCCMTDINLYFFLKP